MDVHWLHILKKDPEDITKPLHTSPTLSQHLLNSFTHMQFAPNDPLNFFEADTAPSDACLSEPMR